MEIQQLREFAAIAETGSFSKAARRRIAQPPLSRHIRQLEEARHQAVRAHGDRRQIAREGAMLLQQARTVLDASALVDLATRARAGRAGTPASRWRLASASSTAFGFT
jgi:DNA-binding transcriptional LysR family regulator